MPTAGVIVGPQTTGGLQLILRSPNTQNNNAQQAQVTCNGTQILLQQQPRQQSNQVSNNFCLILRIFNLNIFILGCKVGKWSKCSITANPNMFWSSISCIIIFKSSIHINSVIA